MELLADINADIVRPPILGLLKASLAREEASVIRQQPGREEGRKEDKINGEEAPLALGRSSIHSALPLAVAVGRSPLPSSSHSGGPISTPPPSQLGKHS